MKLAKEIALSENGAIVYELNEFRDNEPAAQRRSNRTGSWLSVPNRDSLESINPASQHSLEILTRILYCQNLSSNDPTRTVKRRLNDTLQFITGHQTPLHTVRGVLTQINQDLRIPIIGLVHELVHNDICTYDAS